MDPGSLLGLDEGFPGVRGSHWIVCWRFLPWLYFLWTYLMHIILKTLPLAWSFNPGFFLAIRRVNLGKMPWLGFLTFCFTWTEIKECPLSCYFFSVLDFILQCSSQTYKSGVILMVCWQVGKPFITPKHHLCTSEWVFVCWCEQFLPRSSSLVNHSPGILKMHILDYDGFFFFFFFFFSFLNFFYFFFFFFIFFLSSANVF